jgi:hypothetical protein
MPLSSSNSAASSSSDAPRTRASSTATAAMARAMVSEPARVSPMLRKAAEYAASCCLSAWIAASRSNRSPYSPPSVGFDAMFSRSFLSASALRAMITGSLRASRRPVYALSEFERGNMLVRIPSSRAASGNARR